MLICTRLRMIAAAFLLTAAAVVSAQDASDDKRPRALTVAEQLAIEEAKESLRLNRDRVLFWLTKMARATDEQIISMFVSRVIVTEDGGRHVLLMIDEEPPDGVPDEGWAVHSESIQPDQTGIGRTTPFALYIIRHGFVLVWR